MATAQENLVQKKAQRDAIFNAQVAVEKATGKTSGQAIVAAKNDPAVIAAANELTIANNIVNSSSIVLGLDGKTYWYVDNFRISDEEYKALLTSQGVDLPKEPVAPEPTPPEVTEPIKDNAGKKQEVDPANKGETVTTTVKKGDGGTEAEKGKKEEAKTKEENKPYPNSMMDFSTSTYSVSLYLQTPADYNKMIETGEKSVQGMDVIIQSGGITAANAENSYNAFGAQRNRFFEEDFYMNNIQFKSLISGLAVGAPHNSYEISFTVTEPMGLTFMDRLDKAIEAFNSDIPDFNFINQFFVMVIRFYGYDEKGMPASLADIESAGSDEKKSDPSAVYEKWIPFRMKNISFRLAAEQVVYSIEAIPAASFNGNDKIHGTIPFNVGLQAQNIGDLLNGTETLISKQKKKSTTPPPGGVVLSGLSKVLNTWQTKLANCGKQEYADIYEFAIHPDIIKESVAKGDGTTLIDRTGMPNGQNQADIIKSVTGTKSQSINGVKVLQMNSGMKILTFLDLAIRSSTFISNQYKFSNDPNKEKTGTPKNPTKKDVDVPLRWFKIRTAVKILEGKYDCVRGMYASKITYTIEPYDIITIDTPVYSGTNQFVPHKEYNYWFTGKNTEVLNFAQQYNALYYAQFGSKHVPTDPSNANSTGQHSLRSMKGYTVNSKQSNQGGDKDQAEQAANMASTLYSPADQGNIALDILGDPDWIAQSEIFYSAEALKKIKATTKRSLPDRSVNYDSSEIFFALTYNTVVDYNIDTGLADTTQKNLSSSADSFPGGVARESFLYRANTIVTQLNDGKFTQRLEGSLQSIPDEFITGKFLSAAEKTRIAKEKAAKAKAKHEAAKAKAAADKKSAAAGTATKVDPCKRSDIKKLCKGKHTADLTKPVTNEKTASESKTT